LTLDVYIPHLTLVHCRYEDGNHEDGSKPTEFPGKSLGKVRGNAQV
jgi:hypothetical protein